MGIASTLTYYKFKVHGILEVSNISESQAMDKALVVRRGWASNQGILMYGKLEQEEAEDELKLLSTTRTEGDSDFNSAKAEKH